MANRQVDAILEKYKTMTKNAGEAFASSAATAAQRTQSGLQTTRNEAKLAGILAKYGGKSSAEGKIISKAERTDPLIKTITKTQSDKAVGDDDPYIRAIISTQPHIARKDSMQDKAAPYADSALFNAVVRVRSGKSVKPSLEEVYAAAAQRVETSKPESRYQRGGSTYKAEDDPFIRAIINTQKESLAEDEDPFIRAIIDTLGNETYAARGTGFSRSKDPTAAPSGFGGKIDRTEADRKEAGALAAKLRLGEATEQDFEAYLEDIKNRYGYVPTAGSQEEMLDEVQSYLRSQQPKAKNFAEQRAEGTDPLSRIGNTVTGAAKQFAGGFSEAVANVAQNVGTAQIMNHFTGSTTPADPFLTALTRPLDQKIAQAGRATADKLMESGATDIAKAQKGLNPAGRLLVNAGVGVTQMAGDAAIGIATGGGAMLPMMVRSFGNGAQEARQKGYSEEQQMALGLANAATEFFSEKLFGGNPVYDRDAGLINKLVGKIVKNPKVMEVLASTPVDMLTEGLEEIASDILNPVAELVITGNWTGWDADQIIEDGAVGVLTAMIAKGGAAVTNRISSVAGSVATAQEQKIAPLEGTVKINPGARETVREQIGKMPSEDYQIPRISMPQEALVQEDGSSVPESRIPSVIRRYMAKLFRGKVLKVGTDHTVYIDKGGVEEFTFPAKRITGELKTAKMTAGANLDTTLEPAQFLENGDDDGHHPEATGGWDYFYVMFETDTGIYSGIVKTKITDRGRVFHDITEIQKESGPSTRGVNGETPPPAKTDPLSSDPIIPSSDDGVKG